MYSMLYAMNYGIMKDCCYPYTGKKGTCEYDSEKILFTPTNASRIRYSSPDVVTKVLA